MAIPATRAVNPPAAATAPAPSEPAPAPGASDTDIHLLPGGELFLPPGAVGGFDRKVGAAFGRSVPAGLVALATAALDEALPAGLAFWRGLAGRYLTALREAPPGTLDGGEAPAPVPDEAELDEIVTSAPPAPGMEYLTPEVVASVWDAVDGYVADEAGAHPDGLEGWLHALNPLWNLVGRVSFHLAENRGNDLFPFAFLATYTHRIGSGGKLQYLPLGRALTQYAGQQNTRALRNLLAPVQAAAAACDFARELLESRQVFQALAWSPAEAHRFIRAVPELEAAGLVVKVPDWWKHKAPPRATVTVQLDTPDRTTVGLDAMLKFDVRLAVGDEVLTPEEWKQVMAAEGSLVSIKGRWVEVDREKLQQVLDHWEQASEGAMGSGIGFLAGMRLLAGVGGLGSGREEHAADGLGNWTRVVAGENLRTVLAALRDPASSPATAPDPALKAELRPYQRDGLNWLWHIDQLGLGGCLADDMGLGKTVQVLALLLAKKARRMTNGGRRGATPGPALLVVPASLVGNWRAEAERFAPSLRTAYAHRSQMSDDELAALADGLAGYDAVVTTYATLGRLPSLAGQDWDLVVLDEAQAIKNPGAGQTKRVKALRARTRLALTGTPIENSAGDLWSLFDFLNPGLLGSAGRFGEVVRTLSREGGPGFAPLRRLVSPYLLRRLKTDRSIIADLPDKTEVRAFTPLTKGQAALYQRSVRQLAAELADPAVDGIRRSGLVLSYLMRLKQICDHPGLWTGSGNFPPADSGKMGRLGELAGEMAERGEKVLVFTQFREMTAPLADFLAGVFGRPGLVLHGGTSVARRKGLVDQFQSPAGPPFFVLSLKAGGTGLNLTAATHVIHFDRWWNPAVENQATDRAFRIGQKRNVLVHKFVCPGTVEERIDKLIAEKSELADEVLAGGAEKLLTRMGDDELLDFIALDLDSAVF